MRKIREELKVYDGEGTACLSIEEAAKRKGISAWALRKRIKQGAVKTITVGGRLVIPITVLDDFQPDRQKIEAAKRAVRRNGSKPKSKVKA